MNELINASIESIDNSKYELAEIKKFLLANLNNFKTRKNSNASMLIKLVEDIDAATSIDMMTTQLGEASASIKQESIRLKTLLYTLRKQVENREHYKTLGVSDIFPNAAVNEPAIPEIRSIRELRDLRAYLNRHQENYHLAPLEIVTVYGNVKKHGNIFGHAILKVGDVGYLHIENLWAKPEFIPRDGLRDYLNKNDSFVVDVQVLTNNKSDLTDQSKMIDAIKDHSQHRWFWVMTHHNCLSFARQVARACGIDNNQLGHSRGEAKLPILFRMSRENAEPSSAENHDKKNTITSKLNKYMLILAHNTYALAYAGRQKFWKNEFRPENAAVTIVKNNTESELQNNHMQYRR